MNHQRLTPNDDEVITNSRLLFIELPAHLFGRVLLSLHMPNKKDWIPIKDAKPMKLNEENTKGFKLKVLTKRDIERLRNPAYKYLVP